MLIFVVTVVIAMIYGAQLRIMNRQLRQMILQYPELKKSADAAKSAADTVAAQVELADRPWVAADIYFSGPFDFNVNGANVRLSLNLLNTGHSPALNTQVEGLPVDVNFIGNGGRDASHFREQVCQDATEYVKRFSTGIALFPNRPATKGWTLTFNAADLARDHGKGSQAPDVIIWPSVVICIGYKESFDKEIVHHTSYIIDLTHIAPDGLPTANFKIGQSIPQNLLRWALHPERPIEAD